MGVFTYETENTSVIPPAKMFKAVVLDPEKLIPKIAPLAITSIDIIEGNGQPQSTITFGVGSIFKDVEHRIIIDDVRRQTLTHVYGVIDWLDILGKTSYETKIVASPGGGSILKSTSKYYTNGDHEIMEEQVRAGKEKASKLFKDVERFILAHPDFYN